MASSLTQQQSSTQFSFNSAPTKFFPLDLDQSSLYSLYAASAAAAAATGPFPSLFNERVALQSLNGSTQLIPGVNKSELMLKDLFSPLTTIPTNHMLTIGGADIIQKTDGSALSAFTPYIIDNNGTISTALPKGNVVRIAKSDYFNSNQQIVSSSTVSDSDGQSSSSSESSSSSVTSRVSPLAVLPPQFNQQQTQCPVKVIVGGETVVPVSSANTTNFTENSSVNGVYDNNIIPSSSSSPSSSFQQQNIRSKNNNNNDNNNNEAYSSSPKSKDNNNSGKKRKELIRDDAYWERRRKNNDAAKRSRDSRRRKEDEIAIRAAILEQENLRLRFEIERLKSEIERYRLVTFSNNNNNNNNKNNNSSNNNSSNNNNSSKNNKNNENSSIPKAKVQQQQNESVITVTNLNSKLAAAWE